MTNTNLFSTASETITWLRKIAVPMQNFEGESLPDTGIASVTVPKRVVDNLLAGVSGTVERTTGKQSVYNFTFDKLAYTLQVNFGWSDMKRITFTWDHRTEEPTPEPDPLIETEAEVEMFKFFYRDLQGNTTLEMHPFEAINNYRMMDGEWLVWRAINGVWRMIAQSKDWSSDDVTAVMLRDMNRRDIIADAAKVNTAPESSIINGLLVEYNGEVTRIYFEAAKDVYFSSHLKVFQGTHISLEGNVTHLNYAGFVKASTLAGTLLKMVKANKQ